MMDGLDNLFGKLDEIEARILNGIRPRTMKNAKKITARARMLAPVNKLSGGGKLREGIINREVQSPFGEAEIDTVATAPYSVYVELGTGIRGAASPSPPKSPADVSYRADWPGMQAQPFMYPALSSLKDEIVNDFANLLKGGSDD